MADKKRIKIRYETFHRAWTGLIVCCFLIVVIASTLAGASTITVTYRSMGVIVILGFIGRIIIKAWSSWEEMRRGASRQPARNR